MDVKRLKVLWPVGPHGYGNEDVVLAKEFDRVTAERDQLHVRLTDIEQKADDLLTQLNLSTERVRDLTESNGALRVRIANLEQALAGMLHEFDDGVNGGRAERVPALEFGRTLVKAADYAPRPVIFEEPDNYPEPAVEVQP